MKHKKFILFVMPRYEACGGLNDIHDSFETLVKALDYIKVHNFSDDCEFEVVDRDSWEVVFDSTK